MLLLNGELLATAALPLPNRGLGFGDGFFETMVFVKGRLRFAAAHLGRMQQAAAGLHLELPAALARPEALATSLGALLTALSLPAARVRLQVWRSGGGLYTPETNAAEWLATAVPYVANNAPVLRADFAQETHAVHSPLSFCKGPQAWLYVRAAQERQRRALDEIILCDGSGHVAEAGAAAIFWMKNGALFTPALNTGCVAGVRRAQVLQLAQAEGVACHEGLFKQSHLLAADSAFTANVAAVRPVQRIGSHVFAGVLPAFLSAAQTDEQW